MTALVVDTSVIIKLFLPEEHSDVATRIVDTAYQLHAPHHAVAEFGNVPWKHARGRTISAEAVATFLQTYQDLSLTLHELLPLLPDALDIATRHDRTVYDALYVALAQRLEARFVTADRRLYNALAPHYPETMLWVEDLPEDESEG